MKKNLFSKVIAILLLLPWCFFAQSTIYVATNGSSNNSGTSESSPTTLENALSNVSSGGTIYVKGGTYNRSSTIVITSNGSSGNLKKVFSYSGTPILKFSMSENSSSRGIVLDGNYWHFKGIIIEGAGDNGMLLSGNNNKIENCIFRKNQDTGLQLSRYSGNATSISQWPSNNLILNCEAYDNRDSDNEDADGFAAKLTCGTGNIFRGCVSHHNIDDGWDLYTKSDTGPIGAVLFEDCIAHSNGTLTTGGSSGGGDKNGYKLGSSSNTVNHILRRCIAYNNGKHGFTDNGNIGSIEFTNCTSYNNGGYNIHTRDNASHTFKNMLSFENSTNDRIRGNSSAPNSFVGDAGGFSVSSSDFETLSQGSNSNPTSNGFLNLKSGSDLIDAGVTTSGISYNGSKPDLGAIEYGGSTPPPEDITVNLSASPGNGSVGLSWTATGNPSTYEVYRDTDSNPSGRSKLANLSSSTTSYTDNNANNGTTYYYWIKADGSINSNAASATPTGGGDVSVNLSAVAGNGSVSLNWTVSGSINRIDVYRDTDSNPSGRSRIANVSTSTRSYTDNDVNNGTTYYYWIKVRGTDGEDYNSNGDDAKPTDDTPPLGGDEVHDFTVSGKSSSFYNITGNLSTSKGDVSYNGLILSTCLKIESSTNISFSASAAGTLTLVFNDSYSGGIKIDGSTKNVSSGILTTSIGSGSHTITKGDTANLYYMVFTSNSSARSSNVKILPNEASLSVDTENTKLSVYPNPTKSYVTVKLPASSKGAVSVFNTLGQLIQTSKLENGKQVIDMTRYNNGIYYIKIFNGEKEITKRVIKN